MTLKLPILCLRVGRTRRLPVNRMLESEAFQLLSGARDRHHRLGWEAVRRWLREPAARLDRGVRGHRRGGGGRFRMRAIRGGAHGPHGDAQTPRGPGPVPGAGPARPPKSPHFPLAPGCQPTRSRTDPDGLPPGGRSHPVRFDLPLASNRFKSILAKLLTFRLPLKRFRFVSTRRRSII
jgi:hypothetical protein